jgi:hypothetical protein
LNSQILLTKLQSKINKLNTDIEEIKIKNQFDLTSKCDRSSKILINNLKYERQKII